MVMAFLDEGVVPADEVDTARVRSADGSGRLAAALLGLTLAVPLVLSVDVLVIPVLTSSYTVNPNDATASQPTPPPAGGAGTRCREFYAQSIVGVGITAMIPLHAQACWDGTRAYETFGMNASDCLFGSTAFTIVTTSQCERTTTPDGTLSFTYRSQVSSVLLPFLHHDVTLRLVIDRNGRVEQFP